MKASKILRTGILLSALVGSVASTFITQKTRKDTESLLAKTELSANLPNIYTILPESLKDLKGENPLFLIVKYPECNISSEVIQAHFKMREKLATSNVYFLELSNEKVMKTLYLFGSPSCIYCSPDGKVLDRMSAVTVEPGKTYYDSLEEFVKRNHPGIDL